MNDKFVLNKGWSDWIKLVAALLVAVSHYSTVIVINNHWSDSSFLRLWCQGGYIGVAIFFFFSGYGLMESEKRHHLGMMDFLRKRLLKVYLPVLMVSLLWIPIYYLTVTDKPHSFFSTTFIYDVFWDFKDCVLWFVKILFFDYVIFAVFSLLREKGKTLLSNIVMITGTAVATWLAIHFGFPFISVPLFGIGVYSSLLNDKTKKVPMSMVLIAVMAIICGGIYLIIRDNGVAHGILNCGVLLVALGVIYKLSKITPPILPNYIIQATFVIYIVHFKVLDFMVANWGHIPFWSWTLATIVVTMLITAIKMKVKI